MRRTVSIILAAAILCLALTACGSRQKTDLSNATTIADLKGAVIAGQAGTFHLDVIDQIDGVDFDVPEDMDYDDPYQDLHIHFKAGLQHLDGQQSMEVVRFRHNSDKDNPGYGGRQDIGRIGTQQAFLKTVAQKLMKLENVPAMAETFLKYVKTDLTLGNLVWLANQALSMGGTDAISFATLPGDGSGYYNKQSVYVLDAQATCDLVNEALNPYNEALTLEDMDILVP